MPRPCKQAGGGGRRAPRTHLFVCYVEPQRVCAVLGGGRWALLPGNRAAALPVGRHAACFSCNAAVAVGRRAARAWQELLRNGKRAAALQVRRQTACFIQTLLRGSPGACFATPCGIPPRRHPPTCRCMRAGSYPKLPLTTCTGGGAGGASTRRAWRRETQQRRRRRRRRQHFAASVVAVNRHASGPPAAHPTWQGITSGHGRARRGGRRSCLAPSQLDQPEAARILRRTCRHARPPSRAAHRPASTGSRCITCTLGASFQTFDCRADQPHCMLGVHAAWPCCRRSQAVGGWQKRLPGIDRRRLEQTPNRMLQQQHSRRQVLKCHSNRGERRGGRRCTLRLCSHYVQLHRSMYRVAVRQPAIQRG